MGALPGKLVILVGPPAAGKSTWLQLKRNARRPAGKRVPEQVVIGKHRELEMPVPEEGFDRITVFGHPSDSPF